MLRAIFLLPRRKDLTHSQFIERLEHHIGLMRKVPGAKRVGWVEAIAAPDGRPPCDAVIEMAFDDLDEVRTAINSEEARRAEAHLVEFVDFGTYQVFLTAERPG